MTRTRGFTLLELLIVLAIGSGLLTGVAYLLNLGIRTHNSGVAEAEARQTLEFALQEIGRALRETQDVLVPNTHDMDRNDNDPAKNLLVVSLSPVLDANNDGFFDADNDRDGVVDWQVRQFAVGVARQFPLRSAVNLPRDMTNDNRTGVRGIDDDGDDNVDEAQCSANYSNDETTCDYNWNYEYSADWLDAVVFMVRASSGVNYLVQRQPAPLGANGQAWTNHALARNVTVFTVKRITSGVDRELVEVKLCVAVDAVNQAASRSDVCAFRVWRVGGWT